MIEFCTAFRVNGKSFSFAVDGTLLEQQGHSLNQYVEEAKTRYDRTKSFRYDIRNYIAVGFPYDGN